MKMNGMGWERSTYLEFLREVDRVPVSFLLGNPGRIIHVSRVVVLNSSLEDMREGVMPDEDDA